MRVNRVTAIPQADEEILKLGRTSFPSHLTGKSSATHDFLRLHRHEVGSTVCRRAQFEFGLIACVDGLKGFPEAIAAEYPDTKIQLCIVHMVRNSLKLVPWKDYKAVTADLKQIYQASTELEAQDKLEQFATAWDEKYPQISKSWRANWPNLIAIFDYPAEIRKVIYTTNAIESLNSVVRKSTRNRKVFPDDQSAVKVVYLAIQEASKKWTMPIRNWKPALNRFTIEFGERVTTHL